MTGALLAIATNGCGQVEDVEPAPTANEPSAPKPAPKPEIAAPSTPPESTPRGCGGLGEAMTTLLATDEVASGLASTGTNLYFTTRANGDEPFANRVTRVSTGGGAASIVATALPGEALGGGLAAGGGRIAFGVGPIEDLVAVQHVHPSKVVTFADTAPGTPSVLALGGTTVIRSVRVSNDGDVVFEVAPKPRTDPGEPWLRVLYAWHQTTGSNCEADTTTMAGGCLRRLADLAETSEWTVGRGAAHVVTLDKDAHRIDVVAHRLRENLATPAGSAPVPATTLYTPYLFGVDDGGVYYNDPSVVNQILRLPHGGTAGQTFIPASDSFAAPLVDDAPTVVVQGVTTLWRQTKADGTRSVIVSGVGTIGSATVDACNVYVSVSDPPRILARSR